ncbi:hypothetical protein GA0070616_4393 [Micromonospora nigra]|uniref:Uncharacterized protein n=1 Tax=Micromonospora nigra TaxID=145857 RepID=A0A1C6SRC8_9ACTN|nr:hypothetical protein [Micromonospora nigra]SCL32131.1 hypothetical protein GA0070616_4393 [Micromonospora nigra]
MTAPTHLAGDLPIRVGRGVAWLDQHHPGWHDLVNLRELDMDDSCGCVLGQVIGDFWAAPLTWAEAVSHGFQARNGEEFDAEVEVLDRLWRDVIEERLDAADQAAPLWPPERPS